MYQLIENSIEKSIETWRVIVPLHDNDKKEFSEELIDSIRTRIFKEFGGLSEVNVVGQWQNGDEVSTDRSIQIIVDVPPKEHIRTAAFFLGLKDSLRKELEQHKIYVTFESHSSELLSVNEFLQELGFEVTSEQRRSLTQKDIQTLIEQSDRVQKRLGYQTLSVTRNAVLKSIIWEREILGTRIVTSIQDNYPVDAVILSADKLEDYFRKENFGKPLVVIGDYEYQSFILDKEKRRYIIGSPNEFSEYDQGDEAPKFLHEWHGFLKTSEFIPTYVEELLVNYIILRELGAEQERMTMSVGSDGAIQFSGGLLLHCPAHIPDKKVQTAILDAFIKAKHQYESGTIDDIALMQVKVLNRYTAKKAMLIGSRESNFQGTVAIDGLLLESPTKGNNRQHRKTRNG
ncbi:MAG: hypothetical protein WB564_06340 [Dehalococcoidia bacterium]